MGEPGEPRLGVENLASSLTFLLDFPQGYAVRHRVVADPVALRVRSLRQLAARGVGELRAEHEERGEDLLLPQDRQDLLGDAGLGAIVESQGDPRLHSGIMTPMAKPSYPGPKTLAS